MIHDPDTYLLFLECHRRFRYENGKLIRKIKTSPNALEGEMAGGVSGGGYLYVYVAKKRYRVHRLIFLMHHGWLPDGIDHIDTNTLNNRIENLRPTTVSQNQQNVGLRVDNKSGVKGVSWHKSIGKWNARCKANGKRFSLGCFDTIESAAKAVQQFRIQNHGEFANHG